MVWTSIFRKGVLDLAFIDGITHKYKYYRILIDNLTDLAKQSTFKALYFGARQFSRTRPINKYLLIIILIYI